MVSLSEWLCYLSTPLDLTVRSRFPQLKLIIGHLGERIPSDFWRIDESEWMTPRLVMKSDADPASVGSQKTPGNADETTPLILLETQHLRDVQR
jgi:hypothetical protein